MQKPRGVYHHGDLRQALIAEGMAQLENSEAESISLASIARTLQVSQAAPYRHFADRDALLSEIGAIGFEEFRQRLDAAIDGKHGRDAILARCSAYLDFGVSRPGLYKLMFASRLLGLQSKRDKLKAEALQSFRNLVALVATSGDAQPEQKAMKVWLSLHGMVMLSIHGLMDGNPARLRKQQLLELIADI
jgi:AcrR family transcriptional regulator